jgi:hypothetical protein
LRSHLNALGSDATESDIQSAIVLDLLRCEQRMPYRLRIDHDLTKDDGSLKTGACLLHYDWRSLGKNPGVGINGFNLRYCERWILDALAFGYYVSRCRHEGRADEIVAGPFSLEIEWRRISYRREHGDEDDDIPF